MKKISVIIPCYQNEGSISILANRLVELQEKMADRALFSYVLVNDGSTDNTLNELLAFKQRLPNQVKVVKLARNFGTYNALYAGMAHSEGDCHICLHADLQDPPELISDMFSHFLQGNRLVIAYRQDREERSFFSSLYHRMVKRYAIKNIPPGGFDLILFDEKIRAEICAMDAKNTNAMYLITWLGYPYVAIPYTRLRREHGTSQWRLGKKAKLFVDTFFSFSNLPLTILRFFCLCSIISSLIIFTFFLWERSATPVEQLLLIGISAMLFIFGVIMAIVGEYMNHIHEMVRNRPNYVVNEVL